MIGHFIRKPTQGGSFNIFRYPLMRVTEAQDPGPVKLQNIVNIKSLSIFRKTLGMRHLPTGVCWNGCPENIQSTEINNITVEL